MTDFLRFGNTEKTIVDGKETYGLWNQPPWLKEKPDDSDMVSYVVPSNHDGRPDLISYEFYGTPLLSWVIIAFNARFFHSDARDVLGWPKTGTLLKMPTRSLVYPYVT